MSSADHYATLGVPRDASTDDIKKAFRKLARECHPDVAGDSPDAAARFNRVREAYEVLIDPEARTRYDRRRERRQARRRYGADGFRMPGGFWSHAGFGQKDPPPRPGPNTRRRRGAPDLDLEDIFGDFTMGGGAGPTPAGGGPRGRPGSTGPVGGSGSNVPPPPDPADFGFGGPKARTRPEGAPSGGSPGRDIHMQVEVPHHVAARGGTVTLHYPRMRRGDDGRSVFRYDEIHDLRVPPGTRSGDTLRAERWGDAGSDGTTGDLVCDVQVAAPEAEPPPPLREPWPPRGTGAPRATPDPAPPTDGDILRVPVTVSEALLGTRLRVETAGGAVKVTLPPCLRAGARLRLKGRGSDGRDLLVEPVVTLPARLDDESRALIERFAALNPDSPREG